VVGLGILAGLRKAEILNLKWRDIDFEARFIRLVNRPDEGFQPKITGIEASVFTWN
jgi:integrase